MSFLDNLFSTGTAASLKTPTGQIDVSGSVPVQDYVLKVTSTALPMQASWVAENQVATSLQSTAGEIDVSEGTPELDHVLKVTNVSPLQARWMAESSAPAVVPASPWLPQRGSDLSFNDEFDDGSSDLGERGWTCINWATGAAMVRAGDVTWHQGGAFTGNQYRSTRIGSEMVIQTPVGVSMFIYKTFAPGNYLFGMQAMMPYLASGLEVRLWAYNVARNPALPERNAFGAGLYGGTLTTGINQFIYTDASGGQQWNTFTDVVGMDALVADVWTTDLRSSQRVGQYAWCSPNLRQRWRRSALIPLIVTETVAAGVQVASGGAGQLVAFGNSLQCVTLGWIRRDGSTPL